ncbi:MAG TPA: energy-coupling factor transporter transmembrane component T [Candidatus Dormibacteraeota bacterium]|nr:energy-coupling factor transporter transmembrane component T [Candidatus Dormibacteraeota bacterium]
MRLFTPLRPDPRAALARANPMAKLGAAALLMAILFVSVDPLTSAIVLGGLLGTIPMTGLAPRDLLGRTWPILVAALAVGVLNAVLAAEQGGAVALVIGPLAIGADNLEAGLGLGLRLLAIALSGVLALVTTDPTRLADALVQQLHLSPRFAIGALAGARLLPIMADEWQTLALARRARGVAAGRSPLAAMRLFFGQLLALLVGAVRRGTRLATAMEARGFGSRPCRTIARPQTMENRDWILLGLAAGLGAVAVAASVAVGSWRFLLG